MSGSTTALTLTILLCLGLCRGPWDQVQAEFSRKPSIWADPGPMVTKWRAVTIWCQGSLQADGYILYKERSSEPLDTKIPQASSNKTGFLIQPMRSQNTGLYQCAYSTGGRLSERSEPLLLVVTGVDSAPSLSAHPDLGGNVSLLCSSQSTWDTFHLLKEGGAEPPHHRKSEWRSNERRWQAVFPVGPVSPSHGGTYRCYGSNSSDPNVWSQSSDPLHLEVTGVQFSLSILIGISVALVLLLSLLLFLLLFFLLRHRCQSKGRTSDAALKDPQPGEGLELDPQQSGPDDDPKQVTYAQVNCRSRLRQGVATSPSPLSEQLLDKKERQTEEDRQMDSQAAAAEDPQDVTYAQLTLMTPRQETSAPPSSPSEDPPEEPSVYATLAVH